MYYKWKKAYEEKGEEGLRPKYPKTDPELERLRKENERLKKLLAEKELELEIAREFIKKPQKHSEEGEGSRGIHEGVSDIERKEDMRYSSAITD